ncbi:hypothetical protein METY_2548 [Methylopila sp. Yamaguchi]|nr:hypothetical protein METY_2548 [Methylopila sp. Yamaguchi]
MRAAKTFGATPSGSSAAWGASGLVGGAGSSGRIGPGSIFSGGADGTGEGAGCAPALNAESVASSASGRRGGLGIGASKAPEGAVRMVAEVNGRNAAFDPRRRS